MRRLARGRKGKVPKGLVQGSGKSSRPNDIIAYYGGTKKNTNDIEMKCREENEMKTLKNSVQRPDLQQTRQYIQKREGVILDSRVVGYGVVRKQRGMYTQRTWNSGA